MSPPMGLSQPMDPLNVLHCVPGVPNPWAAQQEVSGGRVSEASSAAPHHSHYRLHHPPPTPVCGKIVFHETGSRCQKGWGLLLYTVFLNILSQHLKNEEI